MEVQMAAFGNTGANAPGSVFAELIGGTFQPRDHLCNGPCSYSLSEPLAAAGVADARAKAVVPSYGRLIFAKWTGLQQLDIIPNQSVTVVLDGDGWVCERTHHFGIELK